jgi:hypothetical protein
MNQEPRRSRTRREWCSYGKAGSAAALALALASVDGPAPPHGPLTTALTTGALPEGLRRSGMAPGAGVAQAWDEWCDTDPLLLVITPKGSVVPVFYLTGVQLPAHLALALLGLLSVRYSAVPAPGGGTRVEVSVTVPNGLLGQRHPARLTVSSGALGTGHVYGTDTGLTGERLTVRFRLAAS